MDKLTQAVTNYSIAQRIMLDGYKGIEKEYPITEFMNVMRNDGDEGIEQ